jgi:hypothetical protein
MALFQELDVKLDPPAPMPSVEAAASAAAAKVTRITKATVRQDIVAEIQANGMQTPLEFMLRIMNDENLPRNERMDAAKATIPYVHSKLNSVDINANVSVSHEDALAFLEQDD